MPDAPSVSSPSCFEPLLKGGFAEAEGFPAKSPGERKVVGVTVEPFDGDAQESSGLVWSEEAILRWIAFLCVAGGCSTEELNR